MLPNKPEAQIDHKEAMAMINALGPEKQEPRHHQRKIKGTEIRLNQISRTNTKAVVGEKSIETTETP